MAYNMAVSLITSIGNTVKIPYSPGSLLLPPINGNAKADAFSTLSFGLKPYFMAAFNDKRGLFALDNMTVTDAIAAITAAKDTLVSKQVSYGTILTKEDAIAVLNELLRWCTHVRYVNTTRFSVKEHKPVGWRAV